MANQFALLSLTRYFQIFRHVAVPVVFVLHGTVREVLEMMRRVVRGLRGDRVVALDQAVAVVGHRQVVPSKYFRHVRRGDAPPRTDGSGGSKISPYYNYINPPRPSQREGVRWFLDTDYRVMPE